MLLLVEETLVVYRRLSVVLDYSGDKSRDNEPVAYPGILFEGGGFQQVQLRTEDRENGDLGAVAP
jgi:hypothetical protein